MNMHTSVFAALLLGLVLPAEAQRFTITTPQEEQFPAFELHDPDQDVRTLGTPEIAFDLSASGDTLLDLRIRRSHLTLPDGSPFTAFAGHREHNLIVLAGSPVAKLTITGVSTAGSSREVLVLFADAHGTLIAPAPDQVAVFDTDFNPLPLRYRPASIPQHALLPVNAGKQSLPVHQLWFTAWLPLALAATVTPGDHPATPGLHHDHQDALSL